MCTEGITKVILIILNVVFFLGGGAILAVGIIGYVDENLLYDITDLLTNKLSTVFSELQVLASIDLNGLITNNAIILIAVGAALFFIGFLGCCGACRKSSCLLDTYATIVLLILLFEVGLGVYAYMYSDKLESKIQDGLHISMAKFYKRGIRFRGKNLILANNSDTPVELAWDAIQLEAACCGVGASEDWQEAPLWEKSYTYNGVAIADARVPPACCLRSDDGKLKTDLTTLTGDDFVNMQNCLQTGSDINTEGCYPRVREILFDNKNIVIGVFVSLVVVELLGILCACFLKKKGSD